MIIQYILAWLDVKISSLLSLSSSRWGGSHPTSDKWVGVNKASYFEDLGQQIGIVGVDGQIHTVTSYWAVHHTYYEDKLLSRIPVRKSLQKGERLATSKELTKWRIEVRRRTSEGGGLTIFG